MNANEVELACANYFNWRQNIIVPNLRWSLFTRQEVDLLIIHPSGYTTEIEIKVSNNDIKADLMKRHFHWNSVIRRTFFAVPMSLAGNPHIPAYAGIIGVERTESKNFPYYCKTFRGPTVNKDACKLTDAEIKKVLHCGCMRIWSLKEKILRLKIKEGKQ